MGVLKEFCGNSFYRKVVEGFIVGASLTLVTVLSYRLHFKLATASLLYVIVIVAAARLGHLVTAIIASIAAVSLLEYCLAPPLFALKIDNRLDIVAISTFLIVALTIAALVSRLRRAVEEALSSVDRRLVEAEERERAWVARELHDDVNQRVALVSVHLDRLRNDLPGSDLTARERFNEIREEIANLGIDIQALSHHLHSTKLQVLGIAGTAKGFCKELCEKHAVEIKVHSNGVPASLPKDIAVALFRVLQEALQNAIKHSRSRHFQVRLAGIQGGVELIVHDAGAGFDPAMKSTGLGLVSMRERIKLVNGDLSIASQINRGTTVHARVPLDKQENWGREQTKRQRSQVQAPRFINQILRSITKSLINL